MRFHIIANTGERFWTSAADAKSAAVNSIVSEIQGIDTDLWDLKIFENGKLIYVIESSDTEQIESTLYNMLNVERILEDD